MEAQAITKANGFIEQAEKCLKKWSIFSGNQKFEDAADLYDKAATQFKIAKKFKQSGDYYAKAAELSDKIENNTEACQFYVSAGNAYKQESPEDTQRMFKIAINYYMENNSFSRAAKLYSEIGDMCAKDNDLKTAIEMFSNSADCYETENSTTTANQCMLKVAHLSAELEDFSKSIGIYEKVALASLDNNLMKWSVKDYYFKAALCHLVLGAGTNDMDDVEEALDKYRDLNPAFDMTREYKLVQDLVIAYKEGEIEKFTDVIQDFDSISKLDDWKTTLLYKVKKSMKETAEDEDLDLR
eukprot:95360_1